MTHLRRATRTAVRGGRWLGFELLERRDLLAVIRLVDWNTLNHPNNETEDTNFQTVLQAIGNETVQGNTKRLDILAVQETDVAGNNSIGRLTDVLNALYPSTIYALAASTEDANGGDATGFIYDTSTVTLMGSAIDVPGALTHYVLRGQFRPSGTTGDSDFYVYSVHLKSGDTGADETQRGSEAAILHADANSLGEGAHVLFVGDFNMHTSAEAAYTNIVASGAGQLQDVANAPGNWRDNPAFKSLHTQDPQTTMDDRFDIQFASGEFFNGVGLEYVANSYHVFGNNGTHELGMPITTGMGASETVLDALFAASDHLPVVADYEVIPSTPNVRITQTGGGTKVVEGGLYDTYYAVLDTQPSANVTVTVLPNIELDVLGNGTSNLRQLVFTPINWQTPQVVEVRAINDSDNEGNHTGQITHASASSDLSYNLLTIASVTATIIDNDPPVIVINEVDVNTPSTDDAEFIELYDGGVGGVSLDNMVVVLYDGADDKSYDAFDLDGMVTDANGFFVLGGSGVTGAGYPLSNNSLQNTTDAVALYNNKSASDFPNNTAILLGSDLLDAVVYGPDPQDSGLLVLTPGQLQIDEDQNGAATTQSLSRVPDGGTPRQTSTYVAQAPSPKDYNLKPTKGVLIVQSGTRVDVAEGGATDSYQIALLTIPTADVTITVDPDSQTNLGTGAGMPLALTFTPANALTPQTVTVTAVDDAAVEGTHASVITHTAASADSGYSGIAIGNVVANVLDNDFASPPQIVITEIMYAPNSDETSPGVAEWIEVVNAGTSALDLGGWLIDDDDSANWGSIPLGTVLNPGQIAVIFDAGFTSAATFRSAWSVPDSALVVGVSWGGMANSPNSTDWIRLLDSSSVLRDFVPYDDSSPWPTNNERSSIYLKGLSLDNSLGPNWARSATGAARTVAPTGPIFSTLDIGSPGRFFLPGDYDLGGVVDAGDYVVWRNTLNGNVPMGTGADGDGNGIIQQADYDFWRTNFGNVGAYYGGGGPAASAGDIVTGTALSQSLVASPSEPPQAASANDGLAVDAAVVDMALIPSPPVPAVAAKPVSRLGSPSSVAASADLLLIVDRLFASPRRADDAGAAFTESSDAGVTGIDEFFASLDDWETGVLAERS